MKKKVLNSAKKEERAMKLEPKRAYLEGGVMGLMLVIVLGAAKPTWLPTRA